MAVIYKQSNMLQKSSTNTSYLQIIDQYKWAIHRS